MHFKVPPIHVQIPACILKINAPLTHYLVLFSVMVGLCVCVHGVRARECKFKFSAAHDDWI